MERGLKRYGVLFGLVAALVLCSGNQSAPLVRAAGPTPTPAGRLYLPSVNGPYVPPNPADRLPTRFSVFRTDNRTVQTFWFNPIDPTLTNWYLSECMAGKVIEDLACQTEKVGVATNSYPPDPGVGSPRNPTADVTPANFYCFFLRFRFADGAMTDYPTGPNSQKNCA